MQPLVVIPVSRSVSPMLVRPQTELTWFIPEFLRRWGGIDRPRALPSYAVQHRHMRFVQLLLCLLFVGISCENTRVHKAGNAYVYAIRFCLSTSGCHRGMQRGRRQLFHIKLVRFRIRLSDNGDDKYWYAIWLRLPTFRCHRGHRKRQKTLAFYIIRICLRSRQSDNDDDKYCWFI